MKLSKFLAGGLLIGLFLILVGGIGLSLAQDLNLQGDSGSLVTSSMVYKENTIVGNDQLQRKDMNIAWVPIWTGGGLLNRQEVGDFDCDGSAEMLFHYQTKFANWSNVVLSWNGERFESQRASPSDFGEFSSTERLQVGDFDQDHCDELLVNWHDPIGGWLTHIYDYDNATKKFVIGGTWARNIASRSENDDFEIGNFDGDSYRDDLVVHKCNSMACYNYVYLSDGIKFSAPHIGLSGFGVIDENARLRVGDFNSDGLDDLLVNWRHPTLGWITHIYTYDKHLQQVVFERGFEPGIDAGGQDGNFEVGDFDGDSYRDDILVHTYMNHNWYNYIHISDGNTFAKHGPFLSGFGLIGSVAYLRIGDFNGDMQQELSIYWHHSDFGWLNHIYKYNVKTGRIVFYDDWSPVFLPYTVFMLKADDFSEVTEPHWDKFIAMIVERKIKASIGIVGSIPSVTQVRVLATSGTFEFWNHGYNHAPCNSYLPGNEPVEMKGKTEFHGLVGDDCQTPLSGPYANVYEYQQTHFGATQQFFTDQLGFDSHTFGAPYNFADDTTQLVLSYSPTIRSVFCLDWIANGEYFDCHYLNYLNGKSVLKIVIEEGWPPVLMGIEDFIKNYYDETFYRDESGNVFADQPQYLVLQVHPAAWDLNDGGQNSNYSNWSDLNEIVDFLIDRDTKFMNPYEYDLFWSSR